MADDKISDKIPPKKRKMQTDNSVRKNNKSSKDKKVNVSNLFEEQAQHSGDEESVGSQEMEEEDNQYVLDDFVVEEDDVDDPRIKLKKPEKKKLKRIRRRKETLIPDDEDLDLIRHAREDLEKEKRVDEEESNSDRGYDEEIAPEDDDSEGEHFAGTKKINYLDEDEDSDMEGFLVEDGRDENDENPVPRQKKDKRQRQGPSYDQINNAAEIFGIEFDDFAEENEEDILDPKGVEKDVRDKLRNQFDRKVLVENFCTENDDIIRQADRPERHMARIVPGDQERSLEAQWMAGKIRELFIAEATLKKDFQIMHDKTLGQELREAVEMVLRFYQVDQLEVPFIWTYRKDYLHPRMTRSHLWKIIALDESWGRLVAMRRRVQETLQAVEDSSRACDDESDRLQEAARRDQIQEMMVSCRKLTAAATDASEEHEAAMKIVDKKDERDCATEEDRERVSEALTALEALQSRLADAEDALRDLKKAELEQRRRRRRGQRYHPEAAREVLRLFPKERYLPLVEAAGDELELRDMGNFLSLLLKGAEARKQADATESKMDEMLLEADRILQEGDGQAAAASSAQRRLGGGRDEYSRCRRVPGLRELAELFTVPACDYGDGLRHSYNTEPPQGIDTDFETAAQQFLQNLDPEQDASSIVRSTDQLRRALAVLVGSEIAAEPGVRRLARETYRQAASLSTKPTKLGISAINPFSPLFGIHNLQRKPIQELFDNPPDRTLFLRILEAEKNGFLSFTIHHPQSEGSGPSGEVIFEDDLNVFNSSHNFLSRFLSSETRPSSVTQSWNSIRHDIIDTATQKYLLPALNAELVRELTRHARESVLDEIATRFAATLRLGPYRPPAESPEARREDMKQLLLHCPRRPYSPTVGAIYLLDGSRDTAPMALAFVDRNGLLKSHTLLPNPGKSIKLKNEKIRDFLFENQPELIVFNASGGTAVRMTVQTLESGLLDEVREMIKQAREREREKVNVYGESVYFDDDEQPVKYAPHIASIGDELPTIFKGSVRSKKMFPDCQPETRAAICLARLVQEPLAEYCALWTSADAVDTFGFEAALFLDLHPLKGMLRGLKLPVLRVLEQCLVDAVCEVGVDINRAVRFDHYAPILAFVGGLGLRKADALRQGIRKTIKTVQSRAVLLSTELLGVNVYTNAAGFLRVTDEFTADLEEEGLSLDPLDDTRIHPECYNTHDFAKKICADALEVEPTASDLVRTQMAQSNEEIKDRINKNPSWLELWYKGPLNSADECVETVVHNGKTSAQSVPVEVGDALSQLMLDDYAEDLEKLEKGKRRQQLEQIKDELRFPWLDLRTPLASADDNERFSITTGESDDSLYVGLRLGCTVLDIRDDFDNRSGRRKQTAVTRTETGMRGFINVFEIVDERIDPDNFNITDKLNVGMQLLAVVVSVSKARSTVELSVRPSLLSLNEADWMERRDSDKYASRWWREVRQVQDPSAAFDRHFDMDGALSLYRTTLAESATAAAGAQRSVSDSGNRGTGVGVEKEVAASGRGRDTVTSIQAKKAQSHRNIHHPLFANITFKEAEERLSRDSFSSGGVIIRPSSKGPNMLSITWAFQPDWFKHVDVEERDRPGSNIGLGNQLVIQEPDMQADVFSDLDEIYSRYIEPMNDLVLSMLEFDKFIFGSKDDVRERLLKERAAEPTRVPYALMFDKHKGPGCFLLIWLSLNKQSSTPVRFEPVSVRPSGFKIKSAASELFLRPSDLVTWFKKTMTQHLTAARRAEQKLQEAANEEKKKQEQIKQEQLRIQEKQRQEEQLKLHEKTRLQEQMRQQEEMRQKEEENLEYARKMLMQQQVMEDRRLMKRQQQGQMPPPPPPPPHRPLVPPSPIDMDLEARTPLPLKPLQPPLRRFSQDNPKNR